MPYRVIGRESPVDARLLFVTSMEPRGNPRHGITPAWTESPNSREAARTDLKRGSAENRGGGEKEVQWLDQTS